MRVRYLFMVWLIAGVAGCGAEAPPTSQSSTPTSAQVVLTPAEQETFDRTCAACHGVAGTGAPGVADEAAWAERNEQGIDTLVEHTINGYGQMPPMGLCMECTQDEFVTFISYMSGLECEEEEAP